jgi:hypothetical protein
MQDDLNILDLEGWIESWVIYLRHGRRSKG